MNFSAELSGLWEGFGALCEELAHDGHRLGRLIERNPQVWHWATVWLGLVWLCMRWSKVVADANERRIVAAAEARLVVLVHEDEANGGAEAAPEREGPTPAVDARATEPEPEPEVLPEASPPHRRRIRKGRKPHRKPGRRRKAAAGL